MSKRLDCFFADKLRTTYYPFGYTLLFKVLVEDNLRHAKQEQTTRNHNPSYKNISFPFQECRSVKKQKDRLITGAW